MFPNLWRLLYINGYSEICTSTERTLDLPNTFTGGHDMYTVRSRIYRNVYIG